MKKALDEVIRGAIGIISLLVYVQTKEWRLGVFTFISLIMLYGFYSVIATIIYKQRIARSGIVEIDKMKGVEFENFLSQLLAKQGFKVQLTKTTGDFGADLLLTASDGKKIVVQAKRYKNNVGIKSVQEVVAAKEHYKSTVAWVITNNHFTQAATKLARSNRVKLYGREDLIDWILQVNGKKKEIG